MKRPAESEPVESNIHPALFEWLHPKHSKLTDGFPTLAEYMKLDETQRESLQEWDK
jgi:hypothetical protein